MQVAVFSARSYDRETFDAELKGHTLIYLETSLSTDTVLLARGSRAVCLFVNDRAHREVLVQLRELGVQLILLRCAGFNQVDLEAARELGLRVARVPAYSPHAVAEHAVALLLTLNRKIHKAYNRVRDGNFSLEKLMGTDLYGKTVSVIGTGQIGSVFARIMTGFGCRVLAHDIRPDESLISLGVRYVDVSTAFGEAEFISLHCPLNEQTFHLVNEARLAAMKPGAMLINTGRGALIDTPAAIDSLKSGRLGALAIDVYEQEEHLFFRDLSDSVIQDEQILQLMSFPNVLITAHQGFLTREALTQIARTTRQNIDLFESGTWQGPTVVV